jgi:glycerol-3-phosphate dehydrogenase
MRRGLDQLSKNQFDLIVIGGGIVGAGIAREARLRGLSVALFEKGDFAGGTSGRTSGLIHGGIRYLEQGEFGLVREAIQERYHLFHLAPHLVTLLPFLLPIYRGSRWGRLKIKIGMILYDLLSGRYSLGRHLFLSREQVIQLEPNLSASGLLGAARFFDCQMDDARLCLAVLLSAQKRGAEIFNYAEVTALLQKEGQVSGVNVKEALSGREYTIEGTVVVNATGVWVDTVCQMAANSVQTTAGVPAAPSSSSPRVRPTKGIHIVMPKMTERHGVVLSSQREGRVFFVLPWKDYSLVGTTDTDYTDNPDQVVVDTKEIQSLVRDMAPFFPSASSEKVLASFAGLRPLVHDEANYPSDMSRKERIDWTPEKMLVVSGGKFTLFRKMAIRVLDAIIKQHPMLHSMDRPDPEPPIYGGEISLLKEFVRQEIALKKLPVSQETLQYLIRRYGTHYEAVIACGKDPDHLKPMTPSGHPLPVEVIYAAQNESVLHLSDFMLRRTRLAHGPYRDSLPLIQSIAELLGFEMGWSEERIQSECEAYLTEIAGSPSGTRSPLRNRRSTDSV